MPTDKHSLVGQSLGRYRLLRVLGRGAMGVVYEALDSRLARTVAIKTVQRSLMTDAATAADYATRFEREAQAAARLHHPHIVALFDFGEQDDVSYIVMEFIRGRDLAQVFQAGERYTLAQVQRLMTELLDGLGAAHAHGIVHRDVKPANVLLDEQGHVKLADFGVARLVDANHDRTMPGTMVGTPSAMAPEQVLGLAVGSRTDIFSAGLICYQLLTGQRPFTGSGPFDVQRAIVNDQPAPPSTLNAELPAALDAVVAQALAKQPNRRYASAADFSAALVAALTGAAAPLAAAAAQPATGADAAPVDLDVDLTERAKTGTSTAAAVVQPLQVPAAKQPRRWAPAALVALLLLAAGAWVWWRPSPAPPAVTAVVPVPSLSAAPKPAPAATTPSTPDTTPTPIAVAPGQTAVQAATPNPPPSPKPATASSTAAAPQAKPAPIRAAQDKPRAPADPRCADLLARLQLGDSLTPEQSTLFHTRCAR